MERKKNTKKATKAIRIKQDEKVTRIEPASKNVSVKTEPKPKGGVSLSIEMAISEEEG